MGISNERDKDGKPREIMQKKQPQQQIAGLFPALLQILAHRRNVYEGEVQELTYF